MWSTGLTVIYSLLGAMSLRLASPTKFTGCRKGSFCGCYVESLSVGETVTQVTGLLNTWGFIFMFIKSRSLEVWQCSLCPVEESRFSLIIANCKSGSEFHYMSFF